jgi:hypothetical protein
MCSEAPILARLLGEPWKDDRAYLLRHRAYERAVKKYKKERGIPRRSKPERRAQ